MEERGVYNWLIHAMCEALDIEEKEQKAGLKFWTSRRPTGDLEHDERIRKADTEMADICLDSIREIGIARGLLMRLVGKMPRHHVDHAYLIILKGLEREIGDYRMRLAGIMARSKEEALQTETEINLTLLEAIELEKAVANARAQANDLVNTNRLRKVQTDADQEGES
jgi:hypothetical protein